LKNFYEKDLVVEWLKKEFGAKPLPYKKSEYGFNCPFCDNKENHHDYTFNVEKNRGHCWRGRHENCESGHSALSLVALHYNVSYDKAKDLVRSKFETHDTLQRLKKKIGVFDFSRSLSIEDEEIVWDVPKGAEYILDSNSKGAMKARAWLKGVRKVDPEIWPILRPMYIGDDVDKSRWYRHIGRVFFPVSSLKTKGWISYSMLKKSTKLNPKTLNPPGSLLSRTLYLYDNYLDTQEPILLCEGIFDALRMFIFGYNSVALFGVNVSMRQINLLNKLKSKEVVVCLDADASEFTLDKKGQWTSKAIRVAKILKQFYFGEVSLMKLTHHDPDKQTYSESKKLFNERQPYSRLFYSIKKLRAINA